MKTSWLFTLTLLAALAAFVLPASAKGTLQLVEVDIPGFYRPLRIEDEALLGALSIGQFEDFEQAIQSPTKVGTGVVLTRYFLDEAGQEVPFDKLVYFTDQSGGAGYVFYLGIVNGSSEYDGRWFPASAAGAEALRQALDAENVRLDGASSADSLQRELPSWIAWLAGGALAGFGLGWRAAYRRLSRG